MKKKLSYNIKEESLCVLDSWTAGHFLCAAIRDGPTMSARLRKYIKLNNEAIKINALNYVDQPQEQAWSALHIAAKFCQNKSMIQ